MHLDTPDGPPDPNVAWGSDVAAHMLRRFGIKYVSLNPGASYRGLHDSIVNHLGNCDPGILVTLHEDHSVAIAQGYARASGQPMACVLHANVGLMHGMMGLFNAWCDRVPMLVLGATGPVDSAKRRPWIDWIHTMRDQGGLIRAFVKWDDQPASADALVEALARGWLVTRSEPSAPVYICLDAGLQETRLERAPEWPDLARFSPPAPARPDPDSIARAAEILARAERPLILAGRGARTQKAWAARIALAERLGACVLTDLKSGAMFPTDHPAHTVAPFNALPIPARGLLRDADAILSLDWVDLGGALKQAASVAEVSAKIIAASLDRQLHRGASMEYQALAPADVFLSVNSDVAAEELNAALGGGKKAPWRERIAAMRSAAGEKVTMELVAATLRGFFNDPDAVTFTILSRSWPAEIWPFHTALAYLGKDGGGGLGSGPGLSVGAAVALSDMGRYAVSVIGDGDFCMGATALWTAARHRVPLLMLVDNNRSYFNDELHQETVARTRGRNEANRWIGLRMEDPKPDIAGLARAQGAVGIGPVTRGDQVKGALEEGVGVLKRGGVCVVDLHIDPSAERRGSSSIGQRKTG
jgi:thiamine pyrophosphate-dependent acetolactate synthase large subunit-like protein